MLNFSATGMMLYTGSATQKGAGAKRQTSNLFVYNFCTFLF